MASPGAAVSGADASSGAVFSRQLGLYMRKNWIQKLKRNLCLTLCEVLSPVVLVALFAVLFAKVGVSFTPDTTYECSLLSNENSKHDMVYLGRALNTSNSRLAIVGDANGDFATHLASTYPELPPSAVGDGGLACSLLAFDAVNGTLGPASFPALLPYLVTFPSEAALEAYVANKDYGSAALPSVYAAVVFTAVPAPAAARASRAGWGDGTRLSSSGAPGAWAYRLRVNASALPTDTRLVSNDLGRGVTFSSLSDYVFAAAGNGLASRDVPGFVHLQTAVDKFILGAAGSPADTATDVIVDRGLFLATWGCAAGWPNSTGGSDPSVAPALAALDAFLYSHTLTPQRGRMAPFPTPAFHNNAFYSFVSNVFALIFVLSFFVPAFFLIRGIVVEKETKLREGMRMMGMMDAPLILAWYLTYGIMFFFIALAVTATVKNSFFSLSDGTLLFLFFWAFGWSSTALCFLLSTFFSRSKLASIAGTLMFIVSFFPYFSVNGAVTAEALKQAASLAAPASFGLSIDLLSTLEGSGVGVTWNNMSIRTNGYSMSDGLTFLLLDTLLYTLLALYLGAVLPQEFGVPLPWWFLGSRAYWAGEPLESASAGLQSGQAGWLASLLRLVGLVDPLSTHASAEPLLATSVHGASLEDVISSPIEGEHIEPPGPLLRELGRAGRCVAVRGLTKSFRTPDGVKTAVNGLALDMYEGQIFVLLGHNGAGKTTTMSMLTGLIPPSAGDAFVCGASVRSGMKQVRRSLGVCPQHDVLWPDLTVQEHLEFFAGLKEVPAAQVAAAVADTIREVGLTEKRDALSSSLSGGQKRKLSVGIALIGGSKFVVLDEPTSGMDPYSRRSTWQILQNAREGRVLLLTTHFMDEADILGDRIAIMADGRVRCCGGSMFLKRRYGVGYNLAVVKAPGADSAAIFAVIAAHVPSARILSDVGAEVVVQVPMDASPSFPALFAALEEGSDALGAASYGISVTTLEEVFLKVAEEGEEEAALAAANTAESTDAPDAEVVLETPPVAAPLSSGLSAALSSKFFVHCRALLIKRWRFAMRDQWALIYQLLIPVAALLAGLALLNQVSLATWRPVTLGMGVYNGGAENFIPYSSTPDSDALAAAMVVSSAAALPGAGLGGAKLLPVKGLSTTFPATSYFTEFPNGTSPACLSFDLTSGLPPLVVGEASGVTTLPDIYGLSEWLLLTRNGSEGSGGPGVDGSPLERGASRYGAWLLTTLNTSAAAPYAAYSVLVNSSAYHATPSMVNLLHSALAGLFAGPDGPVTSISVVNAPLPFTASQRVFVSSFTSFISVLFIVIAVSFIPASFALFVVKEREVSAKHQQLISGVSIPAYWASTYFWDMGTYALPCIAAVVLIVAYNTTALIGPALPATIALFVSYGLAVAPFTYVTTFAFTSHSSAQTTTLILNMMCLIVLLASFTMNLIPATCDADASLRFLWRLLPGYALGNGLLQLSNLPYLPFLETNCGRLTPLQQIEQKFGPWDLKVTGWPLLYMFAEAVIYFALAVGIDVVLSFPSLRAAILPDRNMVSPPIEEDSDVAAEAERVARGGASQEVIVMDGLRKVYGGSKTAVRDLSFGVPAGQVFGFLGINGAGKTTTMKMVTGDIVPTSGTARMGGLDILTQQMQVRRLLGYCPQFDALLDLLSVREHLELYARIKGVPEERVPAIVAAKLKELDLRQYAGKLAGALSGGNKRKLSVAISLIGSPPLVFLDEPSTGMDPVARRGMWGVINRVATQSKQCSIILTTHSMEEAEALCTRIGIMVGGRLRCLGSAQHLKSKFGSGYLAVFKLAQPTPEHVERALALLRPHLMRSEGATEDAPLSSWRVTVDALPTVCHALGDPTRARMVNPGSTGWVLAAQLQREGSIEAGAFAEWWASESLGAALHAWAMGTFTGASLVERHGEFFRYRLPSQPGRPLSAVFGLLEAQRRLLSVAEYSLSQVTLETIFNNMAAQQSEETGVARGMTASPGDKEEAGSSASSDPASPVRAGRPGRSGSPVGIMLAPISRAAVVGGYVKLDS
jgi:ATP-binding cassette subfamily A (ABC1) protein 3